MIVRSAKLGTVLLGACLLFASAARAEDPKDKSLTEQAREQARKRVRELQDAERSARQELKRAEQKVRLAERQLRSAAADAKQAAEAALSEAKQALEQAKRQASEAGTETLQGVRDLKEAATDKAVDTAEELKAEVTEAAAKARGEAEGAAEEAAAEASATVRDMQAKAHQIMQNAVAVTGDHARRRQARRAAWRELSDHVERPQDVPPSVREELRRHAQRMARLERVRTLANDKNESALVERADALIAREEQRHEKKLAMLWSAMHAQRGSDQAKAGEDEDQEPAEEQAEEEEEQQ